MMMNWQYLVLWHFAKDTLGGVVSSELGWGLILYGEEEEAYLATTEGIFFELKGR